ncbi:branched-chain amino acid ABC transporter permease [Streptomyces sp. NPDC085932]|uniref:branched-chain amino acid ABC transporter permease n=1 Tax=Streptomyces sp. NPDC085932 TaxID=3365741 RepID=UPI0037D6A2DD
MNHSTRSTRVATCILTSVVMALAVLPYLVAPSGYFRLTDLCIYILLATMWNLLAGYAGMVSVGQQAYIGIGAYALVWLCDHVGLSLLFAVPVAVLLAGAVAFPVSFLVFRLTGGYFAIGTWVVAEVIRLLTVQSDTLGAGSGMSLQGLSGTDSDLRIALVYWSALVTCVVSVVIVFLLVRSRFGLALRAVRDEPTAAMSNGVSVARVKRVVFVVTAAGCGAGGALVAMSTLRVQPDSAYGVQWTAFMLFMVVVGGVGTLEGPILGAIIFFVFQEWLSSFGSLYLVFLGALAIAVTLFAPRGLWGLLTRGRFPLFSVSSRAVVPTRRKVQALSEDGRA